ncbi:VTT domain-containing protein [Pseudonocardia nematodicida]|uniref:VTT domain-containing protein n=1 Tax=Pseudonocardia nematodicida TaxID=1206997 RepID=A0ABV1K624_9PSEU
MLTPAVLFPVMLVEGPVATLVAGSLVGAGALGWWPVWLAATAADLIADSLLFLLGRYGTGRRTERLLGRLGLTAARWQELRTAVRSQLPRVVIGAKLVDVGAVPAFLATGMAGVPYRRFLAWNAPLTAARAAVLTGLGALLGGQLADRVVAQPWLAVVAGLALGLALLAVHTVIARITRRTAAHR